MGDVDAGLTWSFPFSDIARCQTPTPGHRVSDLPNLTTVAFVDLSVRAQVHRIRGAARDALAQYPVEVTGVRLISHAYNTSFRVDTADGRRFALRVNVQSRRRPEWIAAEMAWQQAITTDTDLWVPTPLSTSDGALTASVWFEPLDRMLTAVMYSWLPGRDLDDTVTHEQMRAVGRAMATLHTHAETWRPPEGAELPVFDDPLFGDDDRMTGDDHSPLLTDAQAALLARALAEARRHHAAMFEGATPIALHADLHQWNAKWWRGRLSIFDFDDSGDGVVLQDLAITAYYVRRVDPTLEGALHAGYATLRPLPDVTGVTHEACLAARNLLLLNDVLATNNAETKAALETYLPTSVARLHHWLDTGRYDFAVSHPVSDLG
jgi:Ser/Thr protein kinase RdoA (MazF antagonist)